MTRRHGSGFKSMHSEGKCLGLCKRMDAHDVSRLQKGWCIGDGVGELYWHQPVGLAHSRSETRSERRVGHSEKKDVRCVGLPLPQKVFGDEAPTLGGQVAPATPSGMVMRDWSGFMGNRKSGGLPPPLRVF